MNPWPPVAGGGVLQVGESNEGSKFPNNFVRTAKYTVLNFVPKNLFEQFMRVANLYFLVVSILQVCMLF